MSEHSESPAAPEVDEAVAHEAPAEEAAPAALPEVNVVDVPNEPIVHEQEAEVAARGEAHAEIQAAIEAKAHEPAESVEPEELADPDVDYVVRKAESAPGEADLVRAGEARISRVLLAEIDQRRAVDDITTLVAACAKLLDELES